MENVARVLSEEPRLEAVAFEIERRANSPWPPSARTPANGLARRVAEAVHHQTARDRAAGWPMGQRQLRAMRLRPWTGARGAIRRAGRRQAGVRQHAHRKTNLHDRHPLLALAKRALAEVRPARDPPNCGSRSRWARRARPRARSWPRITTPDEWKTSRSRRAAVCWRASRGWRRSGYGAPGSLVLACWTAAYVLGAWEAAEETFEKIRAGALDVHFLMLSVAVGAACIGAWHEGALLLFLFSASGAMEHYAEDRTQREIGALLHGRAAKRATVLDAAGRESEMPVEDLRPGMTVRVTGGRQVPVDLRVTRGEKRLRRVEPHRRGPSRATELPGATTSWRARSTCTGCWKAACCARRDESALQKIINGSSRTPRSIRAPAQRFTDRFGTHVHLRGAGAVRRRCFFVWWLRVSGCRRFSLRRAARRAERVLPRDDAARGGVALCAGA